MQTYELSYLDYYLPNEEKSISTLAEEIDPSAIPSFFKTKEEYLIFVETVLELREVKVEKEYSEAQMLHELITNMFASHPITPSAIDLIIMTREGDQDTRDNLGQFLQYHYKMNKAYVLNISGNHCANIAVVWNMLRMWSGTEQGINNVLVVNAFKSKSANERIVGSYGILGDGAGLMLLSKKPGLCKLKDSVILSNGILYKVDMNKDNSLLHLKYTLDSLKQVMERNSIQPSEIQQVIPQNANILLITNAVMAAGISIQKLFIDNIGRCGHIDSVDFIINLKDVLEKKRFSRNDLLLVLNTGWAGSYVSSLLSVN